MKLSLTILLVCLMIGVAIASPKESKKHGKYQRSGGAAKRTAEEDGSGEGPGDGENEPLAGSCGEGEPGEEAAPGGGDSGEEGKAKKHSGKSQKKKSF